MSYNYMSLKSTSKTLKTMIIIIPYVMLVLWGRNLILFLCIILQPKYTDHQAC